MPTQASVCNTQGVSSDQSAEWHRNLHRRACQVVFVCQMHLADYLITLVSVRVCVCVCVCPPIGCRTITSAILYRFSPNFACGSEMWFFRTLLFLEQTGSRLTILEVCKIKFWQFRDCGGHIFATDRHKNLNLDITKQRWLCTWRSTKPEINFGF